MGLHRNIRGSSEKPTEFKGFIVRHYGDSNYYKIDDYFAAYISKEVCQKVINTYLKSTNGNNEKSTPDAQLSHDAAAA